MVSRTPTSSNTDRTWKDSTARGIVWIIPYIYGDSLLAGYLMQIVISITISVVDIVEGVQTLPLSLFLRLYQVAALQNRGCTTHEWCAQASQHHSQCSNATWAKGSSKARTWAMQRGLDNSFQPRAVSQRLVSQPTLASRASKIDTSKLPGRVKSTRRSTSIEIGVN